MVRNCNSTLLTNRWRKIVCDLNLKRCNQFIFMTRGYTSFQSAAIWKGSHLYSAVAPVGYDDVPICVHGHSSGSVELAVALTVGAKFEQELSVCIVNLGWTSTRLEEANMALTYWNLWELLYLHRVIVKISHDNFVLVVHCNKVRTWMRKEMRFRDEE